MTVRHVDWYADEWLSGTRFLGPNEGWLYTQICNLIYSHRGPIRYSRSELARLCNMHGNALNGAFDRLKQIGKITENDGEISVTRCTNELEKANKRVTSAHENGQKGGRPINKNNGIAKPAGSQDEKLTTNHQPPTTNLEGSVDVESTGGKPPASFAVVAGTDVPPPAKPDPKKELYDLGKTALGPGYGGQITKILKHHNGDVTAALYTMRHVAEAVVPREYLGKILSGEASTPEDYVASMLAQGMRPDGSPLPSLREIELARLSRLSA